MATQSEQTLEDALVAQLTGLGYAPAVLPDEAALLVNLKRQLERHNNVTLSAVDFRRVLAHLQRGNVWQKSATLRDRFQFTNEAGEAVYLRFLNTEHWCQNEYQVAQQISIDGKYRNRYDVTLLVNGLPLVQIELKKRGGELKEAYNQVQRYHKTSYGAGYGLFNYVQLFVISNGVNTKYYANNTKEQSFLQTFYWTDADNRRLHRLAAFAKVFLEPCHVSKMICRYIVRHQSNRLLMVLRPYQYYAVEALLRRVADTDRNGYIWHTTGSGKTLTSFKASQLLMHRPGVHKVVFVVDRKDLDYQTSREFDAFSKGSAAGSQNTHALVQQLLDPGVKLIITTIQKLNTAVSKARYRRQLTPLRQQPLVFVFDECHRSQFGDTHRRIVRYFERHQLFGFTGTPIFVDNAVQNDLGKRTTKALFGDCLHRYVITDAIRDQNVLRFSIEYVGRYVRKDGDEVPLDIQVEGIDTKELLESEQRLDQITDWLIQHHDRKTHGRRFSAIFCVSSVDQLLEYYRLLAEKRAAGQHDLRVATIFSYTDNEADADADGLFRPFGSPRLSAGKRSGTSGERPGTSGESPGTWEEHSGTSEERLAAEAKGPYDVERTPHTRERLDACIADYNALYGTGFSTRDARSFDAYYKDIAKRLKERERAGQPDSERLDILLVVNMFLTGFDAKKVNTLYVDKNLKHHGLIQAFSRTNRILGDRKRQGNIVCFRNLKSATDAAIQLFSNLDAKEEILVAPYETYVEQFAEALDRLRAVTPTPDSTHDLPDEEAQLEFVRAFRALLRLDTQLGNFSEYDAADLDIDAQEYADYKSAYYDLAEQVRRQRTLPEKASILQEVDFETALLHRDQVTVSYIQRLLAELLDADESERAARKAQVLRELDNSLALKSKRALIEQFIEAQLDQLPDAESLVPAFEAYWAAEKERALQVLVEKEQLDGPALRAVINRYRFTGKEPLSDELAATVARPLGILERGKVLERVRLAVLDWVGLFLE